MKYKPVRLTGEQARCVGNGFAKAIRPASIVIRACAILPDHVHVVVIRHRYPIETIVRLLKAKATTALLNAGMHSFQTIVLRDGSHPSPWGQKYRDV